MIKQLPDISPIYTAGRMIGPGHPCLIAAEVGINHNGDMDLAHRTIDAAADAGADAVKLTNYKTEDFISDGSITYEYISQGKTVCESQYEMFKRCELTSSKLKELFDHCKTRGLMYFATPTSESGVMELKELHAPLVKNGSDSIIHLPLVRAMAHSGIPTVQSTGMATLDEIADAVEAYRAAGGTKLILLHCTSSYPTPDADVNLRKITSLMKAFGCPVGFSDHTWGVTAAMGAVTLGACFVEKHFTFDRNLPGPDHRFSSDPAELKALVDGIRKVEAIMGTAAVGPTPSEEVGRREYRLSCVAAEGLAAGKVLDETDIAFRRPGTGLPPKSAGSLIGRKLKIQVPKGHIFSDGNFDK